jgi:pyruvate/2-oxoacid:ferredoxin oxidoreductase beta subunit
LTCADWRWSWAQRLWHAASSGDKQQLIPLIKAAMSHPGFALIDVVSPCVTFNNNPGSTKSYDYTREHVEATGAVDFVPFMDEITTEYAEGLPWKLPCTTAPRFT